VIVVDASALAKYILYEEGWDRVALYVSGMRPLHSVNHIVKEVGNALWKHYLQRTTDSNTVLRLKDLRRAELLPYVESAGELQERYLIINRYTA